jgi:hypothetical protein
MAKWSFLLVVLSLGVALAVTREAPPTTSIKEGVEPQILQLLNREGAKGWLLMLA